MTYKAETIRTLLNSESSFIGSEPDVFFINTVRRTFSESVSMPLAKLPSSEECMLGFDSRADIVRPQSDDIGDLPDHDITKEFFNHLLRTWHPLVPCLHGLAWLASQSFKIFKLCEAMLVM